MHSPSYLFTLLATALLTSAAPIALPDGGTTAAVVTTIGVVCALQAEQCQKVGDGIKNTVVDVATESGARKMDSIHTDGGLAVTIGEAIGNVMGGVKV